MTAPATLTWIAADGTTVEFSDDIVVRDGPAGLDVPPPSLTTAASYSDGKVATSARYDARTVTIPLALFADDVRTARATLARKMNVRAGAGQLRYVSTSDGKTRTLRQVLYDGGLEGDETQARTDWAFAVLSLLALDPYWYGDEQTLVLASPSVPAAWNSPVPWSSPYPWNGPGAGISAGISWNAPLPWNSALPWNGGAIIAPNVFGDVGAWPRFEFTGPASSVELVHLRTGERVALTGTLAAGQTLTVETTPGPNRGITLDGEPAWDRVSFDSTADLALEQDDVLAVVLAGTGVDSLFRLTWTDRWLTPYGGDLLTADALITEDSVVMLAEDGSTLDGEG